MNDTIQVHRVSNFFEIAGIEYVWYFFVKAENRDIFPANEVYPKLEAFYKVFGTYEQVRIFGKNKVEPVVKHNRTVVENMPYTAIPYNKDFLLLNVSKWNYEKFKFDAGLEGYNLKASRIDDDYEMAIFRNILPSDWIVTDMEGLNARWEKECPFIARLVDIWVKHLKLKTNEVNIGGLNKLAVYSSADDALLCH